MTVKNNNYFNIPHNRYIVWLGSDGERDGLVYFNKPVFSIRALLVLLHSYKSRFTYLTIEKFLSFYEPTKESASVYVSAAVDKMLVSKSYELTVNEPLMTYAFLSFLSSCLSGHTLTAFEFDEAYKLFLSEPADLFEP